MFIFTCGCESVFISVCSLKHTAVSHIFMALRRSVFSLMTTCLVSTNESVFGQVIFLRTEAF